MTIVEALKYGAPVFEVIIVSLAGVLWTWKNVIKTWKSKTKTELERLKKIDDAEAERLRILEAHTKGNSAQVAVQKIICRLLGITECSRVNFFQYTNGEKTLTGNCFRYVRCTAEAPNVGVSSIIDEYAKKYIDADFAAILDKIDKCQDDYLAINVKDLAGVEKVIQDTYGILYSCHFKIGTSVWEGVVSFSWLHKTVAAGETVLTDKEVADIKVCLRLIKDLLQ